MTLKENTMSNRFMPRAIALSLAAFVTFSVLMGIDGLAAYEQVGSGLMAQARVAATMA
jgi:hypothetical protein